MKKQYARCDNPQRLIEHGCPEDHIENPVTTLRVNQVPSFWFGSHTPEHIFTSENSVDNFCRSFSRLITKFQNKIDELAMF